MPLRITCPGRVISPGQLLWPYWLGGSCLSARITTYLVCGRAITWVEGRIDTQSDYVAITSLAAPRLGLTLPFARQEVYSGAAGTQAGTLSFPPDGRVGLFVTDLVEYCYLPAQPIGFLAPSPHAHLQRSVLGLTGFLQHFRFTLDYGQTPPVFELDPIAGFPGQAGVLPKTGLLGDFIRQIHSP